MWDSDDSDPTRISDSDSDCDPASRAQAVCMEGGLIPLSDGGQPPQCGGVAVGCELRARAALGPRGPRGDARGISAWTRAGRDVTVFPPSRVGTCGAELTWAGARPGRDRPTVPWWGVAHQPRQQFMAPLGTTGGPWLHAWASTG